jgi:hypothetical protein
MRTASIVCAVLLISAATAKADEWLTGDQIRALFQDRTYTGINQAGDTFSEWQLPDGRVYGHNRREPVENGCWDVKDDQICYYYAAGSNKGQFCWRIQKTGPDTITQVMTRPAPGFRAFGRLVQGNPYGHSDNGKPWTCEPLSSEHRAPGLQYGAGYRLARR